MATVNKGFSDAAVEMLGAIKSRAKFVTINGDGDIRPWKEGDAPNAVLYASAVLSSTCKYVTVETFAGLMVYSGNFDR